jgi:hypothetical protein
VRAQTPAPLNRFEVRAAQRAREAALTPEQRKIRDLEQELTHVRAVLHSAGW